MFNISFMQQLCLLRSLLIFLFPNFNEAALKGKDVKLILILKHNIANILYCMLQNYSRDFSQVVLVKIYLKPA